MSFCWKDDEDLRSNKIIDVPDADQPEEEEFTADNPRLRSICQNFTNSVFKINPDFSGINIDNINNLISLSTISNGLIESSSSLIQFLLQINFFQAFGTFLNMPLEIDCKKIALRILADLSRLPTNACFALINGKNLSLKFLKSQIFSDDKEIQYLSLKCLKHFAQDSSDCRTLILFNNFLEQFYLIIEGCDNDGKIILLIGKIIIYLLQEEISDQKINVVQQILFKFMTMDFTIDAVCQILCLLSEKEQLANSEYIQYSSQLIGLLNLAQNSKYLRNLMKFFYVRSNFFDELVSFYSAGILQALIDLFFSHNQADKYNSAENKIVWSANIIGKVVENLGYSIEFFQNNYFDSFMNFLESGTYSLKSGSIYVLSRFLLSAIYNKYSLLETQISAMNKNVPLVVDMIESADTFTAISIFNYILALISLQHDPTPIISILADETIYQQILMFNQQSEEKALTDLTNQILMLIRNHSSAD